MSHLILEAASVVAGALKTVADTNPTFMTTTEKATALVELARVEAQLVELRLRVMADAGDVADATGAADVAVWAVGAMRVRFEDARADLALATAIDRRYPAVGAALREGRANVAQARVIVRALDALPDDVTTEMVVLAEQHLVSKAEQFEPKRLRRLGKKILDTIAPQIAEAAEARRLAELEAEARRKTRLNLRRQGDGTTRISGLLPDAIADRLATYLEAFTNPRQQPATPDEPGDTESTHDNTPAGDPLKRLPLPRKLGEAFCRMLEGYDPHRLPLHGGDATTVVITISLTSLLADLATADLLRGGHIPGEDPTDGSITAAHTRRLACTADIIPAVLGGDSEILDLGRTQRLFNKAQRKAMRIRDKHCRAAGCDIPATWCEAHHWHPWSSGGLTDLDDGVLLCAHHHHRAHDPAFTAERQPDGDITFHRRT
ncbi:HNH endonuclease signature motif containing protein [soil metagenome]